MATCLPQRYKLGGWLRQPRARPRLAENAGNEMVELLRDLWGFMRERRKFWLAPIIIVMLLLGALIVPCVSISPNSPSLFSVT